VRNIFDNEFRLIGLAERGSIPLMLVCLLALFSTVYIRLASLKLSVQSRSKREDTLMRQRRNQFHLGRLLSARNNLGYWGERHCRCPASLSSLLINCPMRRAESTANPSIERTATGKPVSAAHIKRWVASNRPASLQGLWQSAIYWP
jgi:hypothetical protein